MYSKPGKSGCLIGRDSGRSEARDLLTGSSLCFQREIQSPANAFGILHKLPEGKVKLVANETMHYYARA